MGARILSETDVLFQVEVVLDPNKMQFMHPGIHLSELLIEGSCTFQPIKCKIFFKKEKNQKI